MKKRTTYQEALAIVNGPTDSRWVLMPYPIEPLKDKPDEFAKIVNNSLIELVHDEWSKVCEAARDLSDVGGVRQVQIVRIKHNAAVNSTWVDGKQVKL